VRKLDGGQLEQKKMMMLLMTFVSRNPFYNESEMREIAFMVSKVHECDVNNWQK